MTTTTIPAAGMSQLQPPSLRRLTERLGLSGVTAALILSVLVLLAVFAPFVAPHDPNFPNLLAALNYSSAEFLLGTDALGRDLLSRLIYGAQITLVGPGLVILISTIVGTTLALIAAWCGGKVDTVISWVLDVLFAVPGIVFGMVAVAIFGPNLFNVIAGLAVAYVPYVARVVRSSALRERAMPYVQAAHLQGQSSVGVVVKQTLPNVQPIIVAQAVSSLGFAVMDLAALSFLGIGVQPPTADLGLMVKSGFDSMMRGYPMEGISAGLVIVAIVWSVTVIGDKLTSNARSMG